MSRLLPLGLAIAAALLLTACGAKNTKLIPEDRAQSLKDTVDQVAQRTGDEDCSGAESALRRARNEVSELPRSVDRGLKNNLNDWLDQVAGKIGDDCKPSKTPTPSPSATETQTPTETPTKTPAPETPTPSPTQTTTPPPGESDTPVPTVQPPDSGGVVPGDENNG